MKVPIDLEPFGRPLRAGTSRASLRDVNHEFSSRVLSGVEQVSWRPRHLRQVIRASNFNARLAFRGTTREIFQIAVLRRQLSVMNAYVLLNASCPGPPSEENERSGFRNTSAC